MLCKIEIDTTLAGAAVNDYGDDGKKNGRRAVLRLATYCALIMYVFFTAMYHLADLAGYADLDPAASPFAAMAMKYRASIDCRDYVAQTGDESCYDRWHV